MEEEHVRVLAELQKAPLTSGEVKKGGAVAAGIYDRRVPTCGVLIR
jgi:hypothetical protein